MAVDRGLRPVVPSTFLAKELFLVQLVRVLLQEGIVERIKRVLSSADVD